MYQIVYPKTKSELLSALQKANINKVDVFEENDKRIHDKLKSQTPANIRRTVIIIEEKN